MSVNVGERGSHERPKSKLQGVSFTHYEIKFEDDPLNYPVQSI